MAERAQGIDLSARIHPSALVEPGAQIGPDCEIGPFCTIGAQVRLGRAVVLKSHVVVSGRTQIGDESIIFPFAVVGESPQDLKYQGEPTRLIVGKRCRIREGATLNIGTDGGGGITRIGDDCLLMTGAHIGHDAQLGSRVILANQVAVAGHCALGDDVIVGGLSGIHQFVRIGRGAIIGAVTMVTNDVLPFGLVQAPRGELDGLNLIGLKRRGVERSEIAALRDAYQALAQEEGSFLERAQSLAAETSSPHVREVTDFILSHSGRNFLTPSARARS